MMATVNSMVYSWFSSMTESTKQSLSMNSESIFPEAWTLATSPECVELFSFLLSALYIFLKKRALLLQKRILLVLFLAMVWLFLVELEV